MGGRVKWCSGRRREKEGEKEEERVGYNEQGESAHRYHVL